jgi:hypothetical protein
LNVYVVLNSEITNFPISGYLEVGMSVTVPTVQIIRPGFFTPKLKMVNLKILQSIFNTELLFRYNVRHIALKIAYLGWDYHGFASQENVENTIEVYPYIIVNKFSYYFLLWIVVRLENSRPLCLSLATAG